MLALIPARGGSKGVPGKNIKLLGGSPLIKWTIDEAKRSKYIDKIIVSTDDKDIANLCIELGVGVPFMRPKELAQDDSYAIDTYLYVMKKMLDDNVYCSDDFIVLLPTVPFRNYFDIDKSIELYYENEAESVISAV